MKAHRTILIALILSLVSFSGSAFAGLSDADDGDLGFTAPAAWSTLA